MYIYNKHIIRNLLPILSAVTMVFVTIIWVVQTMNLSKLIDRGIALSAFLKLTLLLLPYFLFIISPLIIVGSVIYVYHALQEEHQLTTLRNAGLSNFAIAKPALYTAFFVTLFLYYISLYLLPISYNQLKSNLSNFKENYVSSIITEKTFNQLSKYETIYVDKKRAQNDFDGVILFDNERPDKRIIFFAKKGKIKRFDQQNIEFTLSDGTQHSYDRAGKINKLHFDVIDINIAKQKDGVVLRQKNPFELFIHEMIWPDSNISPEHQNRLIIDGHVRLLWPLCNLGFVFLALSIFLSFSPARKIQIKQYVSSLFPVLVSIYIHFSVQKIAYHDIDYLPFLYLNIFACFIIGIVYYAHYECKNFLNIK